MTGDFTQSIESLAPSDLYDLYGRGPAPIQNAENITDIAKRHALSILDNDFISQLYKFPALMKLSLIAIETTNSVQAAEYYEALASHVPHNEPF